MGLAAAVLTFLCLAGLVAAAHPPYLSADEVHHVDHAWRVGHGELPRFEDGVTAPIGPGDKPLIQYTFQHPPAFYVLEAPIVTPLLDAGHWRMGVLLGRLVPMAFGALTVLAVAFGASRLGDRPEPALVLGAAVLTAVANPLVGASAAVYTDSMAAAAAALALTACLVVVQRGLSWRWVAVLAAACTVGFATRAAFISVLVVALGSVVFAAVRRRQPAPGAGLVLGGLVAAVGLPVLASGWFYARNRALTGDWTGSQPDVSEAYFDRVVRPPIEVVTDLDFWKYALGSLFPQPRDPSALIEWAHDLAFGAVVVVLALFVLRLVLDRRKLSLRSPLVAPIAVLAAAAGGVVAQQVQHGANGGAPNARYLLPAALPIFLAAAWALLGIRRARGLLLVGFAGAAAWVYVLQTAAVLQRRRYGDVGIWQAFVHGLDENGLPSVLLPLALAGAAAGLAVAGWGLWRTTAPGREPVADPAVASVAP